MGARADLVAQLAPVAPPCFESRMQWVTYLCTAAEAGKSSNGITDVVLLRDPDRINPKFAYCRDCAAKHHLAMTKAGKCNPQHLLELAAAEAAKKTEAVE